MYGLSIIDVMKLKIPGQTGGRHSVATAIANVSQNNGISMGMNLAKILKIFEKIDEAKS